MLCNTDVICYFSVAMKIVYGKLGAIRVVTSQLGFARPFSIRFFARNVVPTVIDANDNSPVFQVRFLILFQPHSGSFRSFFICNLFNRSIFVSIMIFET